MQKKKVFSKLIKYFLFAIVYFSLSILTDVMIRDKIDWLGAIFMSIVLSLIVVTIINLIDKNK